MHLFPKLEHALYVRNMARKLSVTDLAYVKVKSTCNAQGIEQWEGSAPKLLGCNTNWLTGPDLC